MIRDILKLGLSLVPALSLQAVAAEILDVSHTPEQVAVATNSTSELRFRLSAPSRVIARFYDARDVQVGEIDSGSSLAAGSRVLRWNGTDLRKRPLPPEAYSYTLETAEAGREPFRWDFFDARASEPIVVDPVRYDPACRCIRYELLELSCVRIRVGLANDGPLLRTLIDWVPRARGPQEEPWDGRDGSGVVDLSKNPKLRIQVTAFALPRNTILIGTRTNESQFLSDLPEKPPRAKREDASVHRMRDYVRQAVAQRRDFRLEIEPIGNLQETSDGIPIVSGSVGFRLSMDPDALANATNLRSEAAFYVDGLFAFENETGFLPMTWTWDARGTSPGLHYISANLIGYEGNMGIGTQPVWVAAETSP